MPPTLPSADSDALPEGGAGRASLPAADGVRARTGAEGSRLPEAEVEGGEAPEAEARPTRPELDADSRAARIAEATRQGGLDAAPEGYGDADGDWQTIRSDSPFEILFLDATQPAALTPELAARHAAWVVGFWTDRVGRLGGQGGLLIRKKYDPEHQNEAVIRSYLRTARQAAKRLSTREGIDAALARADRQRVEAAWVRLDPLLLGLTADGELTPGELAVLFREGAAHRVSDAEISAHVQDALDARGFRAYSDPEGDTAAERLRSVRWVTAEKYDELKEREAFRQATRVVPLQLAHGEVDSLDALAAYADAHPGDFADALYDGTVPMWVGANLGARQLQLRLTELKSAHGGAGEEQRLRGQELAVRRILDSAEIISEPVIVPERDAIAFGTVYLGTAVSESCAIPRQTARRAWGTIHLTGDLPGLSAYREFNIDEPAVSFDLDATALPPGDYEGGVTFDVEGGDAVSVPIRYTVAPVTLAVSPERLALGALPFGSTRSETVTVRSVPDTGRLHGTVALTPEHPGVRLDGGLGGEAEAELTLHIDTSAFQAGAGGDYEIRVDTNAGEAVVPVTFRVEIAWATVLLWAAAMGAVGAAALGGVRFLVGTELGQAWQYGLGETLWMLGLAGLTVLALLVLAARWLTPKAPTREPAPPAADSTPEPGERPSSRSTRVRA